MSAAEDQHFLMATPAKALADVLALKSKLASKEELERLLLEDMRVDLQELKRVKAEEIGVIAERYRHRNVDHLHRFIGGLK
jgi:hypothetical protein